MMTMGVPPGTRLELIQYLDTKEIRVWIALNKRVNPTLGTFLEFCPDGSTYQVTIRPDGEERLRVKDAWKPQTNMEVQ